MDVSPETELPSSVPTLDCTGRVESRGMPADELWARDRFITLSETPDRWKSAPPELPVSVVADMTCGLMERVETGPSSPERAKSGPDFACLATGNDVDRPTKGTRAHER
jgi:hypothetical protein